MTRPILDPDGERVFSTRTVDYWHDALTGDDLLCFSRYGYRADECAWFAVALEFIQREANGLPDVPTSESLDYNMGLVVNGHDDVRTLILDYWHAVPRKVRRMLGGKREVASL